MFGSSNVELPCLRGFSIFLALGDFRSVYFWTNSMGGLPEHPLSVPYAPQMTPANFAHAWT